MTRQKQRHAHAERTPSMADCDRMSRHRRVNITRFGHMTNASSYGCLVLPASNTLIPPHSEIIPPRYLARVVKIGLISLWMCSVSEAKYQSAIREILRICTYTVTCRRKCHYSMSNSSTSATRPPMFSSVSSSPDAAIIYAPSPSFRSKGSPSAPITRT